MDNFIIDDEMDNDDEENDEEEGGRPRVQRVGTFISVFSQLRCCLFCAVVVAVLQFFHFLN